MQNRKTTEKKMAIISTFDEQFNEKQENIIDGFFHEIGNFLTIASVELYKTTGAKEPEIDNITRNIKKALSQCIKLPADLLHSQNSENLPKLYHYYSQYRTMINELILAHTSSADKETPKSLNETKKLNEKINTTAENISASIQQEINQVKSEISKLRDEENRNKIEREINELINTISEDLDNVEQEFTDNKDAINKEFSQVPKNIKTEIDNCINDYAKKNVAHMDNAELANKLTSEILSITNKIDTRYLQAFFSSEREDKLNKLLAKIAQLTELNSLLLRYEISLAEIREHHTHDNQPKNYYNEEKTKAIDGCSNWAKAQKEQTIQALFNLRTRFEKIIETQNQLLNNAKQNVNAELANINAHAQAKIETILTDNTMLSDIKNQLENIKRTLNTTIMPGNLNDPTRLAQALENVIKTEIKTYILEKAYILSESNVMLNGEQLKLLFEDSEGIMQRSKIAIEKFKDWEPDYFLNQSPFIKLVDLEEQLESIKHSLVDITGCSEPCLVSIRNHIFAIKDGINEKKQEILKLQESHMQILNENCLGLDFNPVIQTYTQTVHQQSLNYVKNQNKKEMPQPASQTQSQRFLSAATSGATAFKSFFSRPPTPTTADNTTSPTQSTSNFFHRNP